MRPPAAWRRILLVTKNFFDAKTAQRGPKRFRYLFVIFIESRHRSKVGLVWNGEAGKAMSLEYILLGIFVLCCLVGLFLVKP